MERPSTDNSKKMIFDAPKEQANTNPPPFEVKEPIQITIPQPEEVQEVLKTESDNQSSPK